MALASDFIWSLFQQNTEADRKNVPRVSLFLDDLGNDEIAKTGNNEISVGDNFIEKIQGLGATRGWKNWNDSYSYTARFLDYCNDLRNGFVAELNKKMRDTYSDEFFVELLGKPVDQLWNEYKARYGRTS
ncbi:hypothetical protein GH714_013301 [Hevea brasiliensis]|uniref:Uncharacterized protein n=1 Tax=Hevea brasiliensis TaxID=3981 RepID=A0A6A6KZV9_HEVBR|nr:hypothetical protein GH714_013301 [Hevea brasiliensis]